MDITTHKERPMNHDTALLKYGIDQRRTIHTTIDKSLLDEVDRLIPPRRRSAFLESLIRSELNEMKKER